MKRSAGLYAVLLFIAGGLCAQQPSINLHQFNTEDGLDAHEVMAITEDDNGFIWLGTDKGLQRFDGSQLKIFLPDPHNPSSINTEKIAALHTGKNQKLWIGSEHNGVAELDLRTMKFRSFQSVREDMNTLASNSVCSLFEDENGLWVLTANGFLNFYSFRTEKFTRYRLPNPNRSKDVFIISPINDIIQDRFDKNQLWLSTVVGLFNFRKTSGEFSNYLPDVSRAWVYEENYFHDIWQDGAGVIWLSNYHGIQSFDPVSKAWQRFDVPKALGIKEGFKTTRILPESLGVINLITDPFNWIQFDLQSKKYMLCKVTVTNKRHWEEPWALCGTKMKDGTIWLGGWQAINKVSNNPLPFYTSFFTDQSNRELPRPNMPLAGFEIPGTGHILTGTILGDGLLLVEDYKTGKCRPIHFRKNLPEKEYEGAVEDIEQKDSTHFWLGVRGALCEYKLGDSTFHPYLNTETGKILLREKIRCLFTDVDKTLWIGSFENGLYHFFPETNVIKHYSNIPGDSTSLRTNEMISDILRGPDNRIWVAYQSCISILDEKTGKFNHLDQSLPGMPRATELSVIDMDVDKTGRVWATTGQGLIRITPGKNSNLSIKSYNIRDGLESSVLNELLIDHNNNLWITTHNSLSFFNTQTESFINFGQSDGISHVSRSSLIEKLSNGIIIYGMWSSLLWFHPDSITGYHQLPKPYLSSIQVNNTDYSRTPDEINELNLSYTKRNISFQVAGLDLGGNFKHYFSYRLKGYDEDWTYAGKRSYVNYTNLPAGKYSFQFKAANSLGQWNPEIRELSIVIQPAFWQTALFWIMCGALLVAGTWLIVRKRITSIRHEAELKQKVAETEMTALRAQMNPHFIFNCINAIDNLIQTNQKDKATTYLARFARLIRSVLDSSKNNTVPFQKDHEALQLYLQLEQFRCDNRFSYAITVDDELLNSDYKVPPMLIQPFVENAIHHGLLNKPGNDRMLQIRIGLENETIHYLIMDNGTGRQKAEQLKQINKPDHVSYGIQISTDRIKLFNNNGVDDAVKITDLFRNEQPAGTKVEVHLKMPEHS